MKCVTDDVTKREEKTSHTVADEIAGNAFVRVCAGRIMFVYILNVYEGEKRLVNILWDAAEEPVTEGNSLFNHRQQMSLEVGTY